MHTHTQIHTHTHTHFKVPNKRKLLSQTQVIENKFSV